MLSNAAGQCFGLFLLNSTSCLEQQYLLSSSSIFYGQFTHLKSIDFVRIMSRQFYLNWYAVDSELFCLQIFIAWKQCKLCCLVLCGFMGRGNTQSRLIVQVVIQEQFAWVIEKPYGWSFSVLVELFPLYKHSKGTKEFGHILVYNCGCLKWAYEFNYHSSTHPLLAVFLLFIEEKLEGERAYFLVAGSSYRGVMKLLNPSLMLERKNQVRTRDYVANRDETSQAYDFLRIKGPKEDTNQEKLCNHNILEKIVSNLHLTFTNIIQQSALLSHFKTHATTYRKFDNF